MKEDFSKQCLQATGSEDIFFFTGEWVSICEGLSGSVNGYIKAIVRCDYCDGYNIKTQLTIDEELCKDECKAKNTTCMRMASGWGGERVKINPNGGDCGAFDSSLPGCEESSSSEMEQSSSSETQSSSSLESSSSVESSSSGKISSPSSSNSVQSCSSYDISSSSEERNVFGYKEGLHLCSTEVTNFYNLDGVFCNESGYCGCNNSSTKKIKYFTTRPDYYGQLKYSIRCYERQGVFELVTNLPYVYPSSNTVAYCFDDMDTCMQYRVKNYVDYAYIPTIYACSANSSNYVVPTDLEKGCSVTKNTDNDSYGVVFYGRNMTESSLITDLDWWPSANILPANFDFYELLKESRVVEGYKYCLEYLKEYNAMKSSSSQSSSSGVSSSSEESSSSLEESSSSDESSSSEETSSSSEYVLCQSLSSAAQSDVSKSSCFENNGRCYRCNAARTSSECASAWSWVSPYHIDKYFFTEIDCESGERKDDNRIGQCPSFPLDSVPDHPEQACVANDEKCYRCKSENNYVDCSYSWLWTGENFGTHNIGSWYEEVDCYDPFEEEDEQCAEISALQKKSSGNYKEIDVSSYYQLELTPLSVRYDALGRQKQKRNAKIVYFKKHENTRQKKKSFLKVDSYYLIPSGKIYASTSMSGDSSKCGDLYHDYGIQYADGSKDYGVYCGYPSIGGKTDKNGYLLVKTLEDRKIEEETCENGLPKHMLKFRVDTKMTKVDDYYKVLKVGFRFDDNEVVTQSRHDAILRHEKGHQKTLSCFVETLGKENYFEIEIEACESEYNCENKSSIFKNMKQELIDKITKRIKDELDSKKDENANLWMNMCGWYHQKYGRDDGPKNVSSIKCPSIKTLMQEYDLTGCELNK